MRILCARSSKHAPAPTYFPHGMYTFSMKLGRQLQRATELLDQNSHVHALRRAAMRLPARTLLSQLPQTHCSHAALAEVNFNDVLPGRLLRPISNSSSFISLASNRLRLSRAGIVRDFTARSNTLQTNALRVTKNRESDHSRRDPRCHKTPKQPAASEPAARNTSHTLGAHY